MGIAEATRGNNLSSAKVLEVQLSAANEMLRRLTAVLAAVLIEQHRGRLLVESATVDLAYGEVASENGYLVDMATLRPLGRHRLQVMLPNGDTYMPKPVNAQVIESESQSCTHDWHRDGVGLRCPQCGRARLCG